MTAGTRTLIDLHGHDGLSALALCCVSFTLSNSSPAYALRAAWKFYCEDVVEILELDAD